MTQRARTIGMMVLWAAVHSNFAQGQSPQPTTLVIDINNYVEYQDDTPDSSKFATNSKVTPSSPPKNFFVATALADIVAVNGQPARGAFVQRSRAVILSPAPGTSAVSWGNLRCHAGSGPRADFRNPAGGWYAGWNHSGPGTQWRPKSAWGAFSSTKGELGHRGRHRSVSWSTGPRGDRPEYSARGIHDGRSRQSTDQWWGDRSILPLRHSDDDPGCYSNTERACRRAFQRAFRLSRKPNQQQRARFYRYSPTASAPRFPMFDPGQPFPTSVASAVNSPVQVTVNGKPAEVLGYAVGYPGTSRRIPVGTFVYLRTQPSFSSATIQVIAAWIAGTPFSIPVQ